MTPDEVSFREHFESLLSALAKLEDERWEGHGQVHASLEEARKLAVNEINRRLDEMNEFRQQIAEEHNLFMTKDLFYVKHDEVTKRVDSLERTRANSEGRTWAFGAIFTALAVVVNLVIRFLFK